VCIQKIDLDDMEKTGLQQLFSFFLFILP
jgi:hypothetical protein